MKRTLLFLCAALFAHPAFCDGIVQGPPIQAADLANHLGVFARSFTYRPDKPFKFLRYALTFKERLPDGTYAEKVQLLAGVYQYGSPQTEASLIVFLDKNKTTLSAGQFSSHARGYDVGELYTTGNPPHLRPGGGYVLLRTRIDNTVTDTEANTRGIVELELTANE